MFEQDKQAVIDSIRQTRAAMLEAKKRLAMTSKVASSAATFVSSAVSTAYIWAPILLTITVIFGVLISALAFMLIIGQTENYKGCLDPSMSSRSQQKSDSSTESNEQKIANAKRIYSVLKTYGMSDKHIAAVLGNFDTESHIDPTAVETVFTEPYEIGPKKQDAIDMNFDAKKFFGKYDPGYIVRFPAINIVGAGIGGFTNTAVLGPYGLIDFSKSIDRDWYELDTQLIFMLGGDEPYRLGILKTFQETDADTATLTTFFRHKWEGNTVLGLPESIANAEKWEAEMKNWEVEDEQGAKEIIKAAEEARAKNGVKADGGSGGRDSSGKGTGSEECETGSGSVNVSEDVKGALELAMKISYPESDNRHLSKQLGGTMSDVKPEYKEAKHKADPNGEQDWIWASCDRVVATIVRNTFDPDIPWGATKEQWDYLSNSSKYEKITNAKDRQPGDILITPGGGALGHIAFYVGDQDGKEIVVEGSYSPPPLGWYPVQHEWAYGSGEKLIDTMGRDYVIFRYKG